MIEVGLSAMSRNKSAEAVPISSPTEKGSKPCRTSDCDGANKADLFGKTATECTRIVNCDFSESHSVKRRILSA